jgi:acetoin utilization deacetylase AcuC-like enzyme
MWSNGRTNQDTLNREASQFESLYLTPHSVSLAQQASSAVCTLVAHTWQRRDELRHGVALMRPPGHHAEPSHAGGFCLLNHVAIAAEYARAHLGVQRVLILDWDVHHGNGTQTAFYNNPHVLTLSLHRWEGGRFYPYLQSSGPTCIGQGAGKGFNVNVAWSHAGMGNAEYEAAWQRLVLPLARSFAPDLILVAAGFDAAEGDPLGGNCVTPDGFAALTRMLLDLHVPIVMSLEGGYVPSILGKCVVAVMEALADDLSHSSTNKKEDEKDHCRRGFPQEEQHSYVDPAALRDIEITINALKPYWPFLQTETEKDEMSRKLPLYDQTLL